MKKGFLAFAAALLQITALGQVTLPFSSQITNAYGVLSSYPVGTYGYPLLQSTTNILRPIFWQDQAFTNNLGFVVVPNAYPQEFFRIGYLLPIFQFAIFYDMNLEIDPGAAMTIRGGPVFCNQSIWEGSTVCTFISTVIAGGTNYAQLADPFAWNFNGSGASTFDAGQISNAPPLTLYGFGTNTSPATMRSLLGLPPSTYAMGTAAAYSSNGIAYPANAADLVISNFTSSTNFGLVLPHGTNMVIYYQDYGLTPLPYDYYMITNGNSHISWITNFVAPSILGQNTNIYYAGFSWVTNVTFRDWREGWNGGVGPSKVVQAVQIDMNLLNRWLTNASTANTLATSGYNDDLAKVVHSGSHISSVYVYNSVPLTSSQLPAVRVMNGGQLPSPGGSIRGFTVATPFPIYVWGDYNSKNHGFMSVGTNTVNTLPAALMGDSITVLSDAWQDSSISKQPSASSTTVNAAMLEGIVPTNPAINGNYSGGLENYMRLLEDWSGSTLTFNGSLVALFYSQYATNSWQPTGNYYNPPTRSWSFDLNFRTPSKLPPLTPRVVNYASP